MLLDIRTLSAVAAIVSALVALSLLLVLRSQNLLIREGLRAWTLGISFQAAGWFLAGLRGGLSSWIGVVVANLAIIVGVAECLHALRRFRGPLPRLKLPYVAVVGVYAVSMLFTYVWPDRVLRMGFNSSLMALVSAMAAAEALRAKPEGEQVRPSAVLVGVTFGFGALVLALRVAGIIFSGTAPMLGGVQIPTWQILPYAAMAFVPVLATLGFALMCNDVLNRELARLATLDPLTGILNRRSLEEAAARAFTAARRHHRPLSLALVDADHFKAVNDTFGHETGDEALCRIVAVLQAGCRGEDALARLGGEEFLVLMADTDETAACAAAERLRASVEGLALSGGGRPVPLRISIGVAEAAPGESFAETLRRADLALYAAKGAGRNRVHTASALTSGPRPD